MSYTREATTEKRNAADFLFPGEDEYADHRYPDEQLAMLAVKTSCKDRWRQVLAEADRIRTKHLLTLEPAISIIQTAEMRSHGLQLVLPASLHSTYQPDQLPWLMGVGDFLEVVCELRGWQGLLI
ncbi:type II restriction endonuclease [Marimonas lutisalis]|uniref:type II restriction endonuclease n=1 Tax=Marimonas lutisalis TaxID=2545756 RepID=UPI0010F46DE4|nr:type II restriction endonuclease [Marimonas lutisalis]